MDDNELLSVLVDLVDRVREEISESRDERREMWALLSPMVSSLRLDAGALAEDAADALLLLRRLAPQPEDDAAKYGV